jgi:hypothetical protein
MADFTHADERKTAEQQARPFDRLTVIERTKTIAIGVLAVGLGIALCQQFAKPTRPPVPDVTSVPLAPRAPL